MKRVISIVVILACCACGQIVYHLQGDRSERTYTGYVATWAMGAPPVTDYALSFDGTSATIPYSSAWDLTQTFTMSVWCYVESFDVSGFNNFLTENSSAGWSFYVQDTVGFVFYLGDSVNNAYSHDLVGLGGWHMLTMSYDSSTATYVSWVDGVPSQWVQQNNTPAIVTGAPIILGAWVGGVQSHHGKLDELVLFSRVLSDTEVSQLYNGGTGLKGDLAVPPFNNGLVAGYHFDEGSGTVLIDFSSGENNGANTEVSWVLNSGFQNIP